MKQTSLLTIFLTLFLLNGCVAYSPEEDAGGFLNSSIISNSIKVRLAQQSGLEAFTINVDTVNGKVLLSGFVQTQEQKELAGKVADNTEGVTKVINNIVVE